MLFSVAGNTDTGIAHEGSENQDRIWYQVSRKAAHSPLALLVVSDGVGGHRGGAYASHWVIETIKHTLSDLLTDIPSRDTVRLEALPQSASPITNKLPQQPEVELSERLEIAVQKAHTVVQEFSIRKPDLAANSGATITMACLQDSRAFISNVGDSRTYIIRDGLIQQITQDHSLVAALVTSGQIQPEDVYSHPHRNIIFRSLGQRKDLDVDIFECEIQEGDIFVLCSDGLWEMVHDDQILAHILASPNLDQAVATLIAAANEAGGLDNISVILCRVEA